jgi:type I restriction enzyme, S subunit
MGGEWQRMPLGDFVTLQRGHDLPDRDRRPGVVPILGSFGITGWHDAARAKGPGVTVGRSGASFGVVSYSPVDFWPLNTALCVIDFHDNDERFAYYLLRCFDFRGFNSGSAQPSLNRNFVHPVLVDVPPVPEQRAIAHVLGTLDDKIELNRRTNETLEAIARALFKSWFVDFDPVHAKAEGRDSGLPREIADLFPDSFEESELGEIPRGWDRTSFAATVDIIGGGTPKTSVPEYWGGDIPWFSVVDAPRETDVWVVDTEKKITSEGVEHSSTRVLPVGTTIISARGTVGRLALVGEPMAMNQSCYGLRGKSDMDGFYTYYSARMLVASLQQHAHGSVFDTITRDTLSGVSVIVPPGGLVADFNIHVGPVLERVRRSVLESRALAALRDTLLPKLISGELRVDDVERFSEQVGA